MQTALESDYLDDESCVLSIKINGRMRQMHRSWLVDSGRAAGSALAKQILGTDEGLLGSTEIHVPGVPDSDFDVAFHQVCAWLGGKDEDVYRTLTKENCPALLKLVSYFCLPLEGGVQREMSRRVRAQQAELRPLVSKIEEWRRFHDEVHTAREDGEDEFATYMFQHRHVFHAPRKMARFLSAEELIEDERQLNAYITDLKTEIQQWESSMRRFAALLKEHGNVVYHWSQALCPGYCIPPLVPFSCPSEAEYLIGAAVGDRVRKNCGKAPARSWKNRIPSTHGSRSLEGTVSCIDDDKKTELSVTWDDGTNSGGLWCGKKGGFELVYS